VVTSAIKTYSGGRMPASSVKKTFHSRYTSAYWIYIVYYTYYIDPSSRSNGQQRAAH